MKLNRINLIGCFIALIFNVPEAKAWNSDTTVTKDTLIIIDTAGVSEAAEILNDYIEALGGREKLKEIEDRTTMMTGTVQDFDIKMTVYQKIPSFLRQEIQASGLDQVIIYNGEEGVMITGEESMQIPPEELERIKFEASLHLLLNPDSAGIKMQITDTLNINNIPVYKVLNSAGEVQWITYYSIENKLKILEEKEVTTPSGVFKQEIWFDDYKEVKGLMYPFTITQKLGPQEIKFSVTSVKVNQGLDDELFEID